MAENLTSAFSPRKALLLHSSQYHHNFHCVVDIRKVELNLLFAKTL